MAVETDLDTADILAACTSYVPVNARVDQAIAAHRTAYRALEDSPDDPDAQRLGFYTLHAVVLARTPAIDDYRAQLDYLTGLPETAWPENSEWSAAKIREETLAAITRSLNWSLAG
jgi:hypothetical protein